MFRATGNNSDSLLFYAIQPFSIPHGKSYRQPLHRHNELIELLLVLEGQVQCKIDDQAYAASCGAVLLVQPGSWHEQEYTAAQQQSGYRLSFSYAHGLETMTVAELQTVIPINNDIKELKSLFVRLQQDKNQPQADSKQLAHHLIALILMFLNRAVVTQNSLNYRNVEETTQEIKHYMEENYCSSLTLEKIAVKFGINKYRMARFFKKQTDMSPLQYIISCRIDAAKHLLTTTDRPVATISCDIGYKSATQFQAAFKQTTGLTPRGYRVQQRLPTNDH